MKLIKTSIFLIISFWITISCTDDHCSLKTDSLLKMKFVVLDTNLTKIKFLDSLSIYSPEWPDSVHYLLEGTAVDSSLNFMLSPGADISEIILSSPNVINDTITFYYQRDFYLLSTECGFVTNFSLDSVKYSLNNIDKVEIINTEITTIINGQIKIYF